MDGRSAEIHRPPVVPTLVALGMVVGLVVARLVLTWPDDRRLPRVVALPGYVFISIVAGWMAWLHLLRQEKSAVWEPTQRPVVDMATPT